MNAQSRGGSVADGRGTRLDKWLWAARFFKTRAIAREMVQAGRVHYNGARAKPGKVVELGAEIAVPQGFDTKIVVVLKLDDKRQGAAIAQTMYQETVASVQQREENKLSRQVGSFHSPRPEQRPNKKRRRELIKMKQAD